MWKAVYLCRLYHIFSFNVTIKIINRGTDIRMLQKDVIFSLSTP